MEGIHQKRRDNQRPDRIAQVQVFRVYQVGRYQTAVKQHGKYHKEVQNSAARNVF